MPITMTGTPDAASTVPEGYRLYNAANKGRFDELTQLLDAGAAASWKDSSGFSPLMIAATNGHERCCQLLLERGADADASDISGLTALHMAAQHGRDHCVLVLYAQHLPQKSSRTIIAPAARADRRFPT